MGSPWERLRLEGAETEGRREGRGRSEEGEGGVRRRRSGCVMVEVGALMVEVGVCDGGDRGM